IWDFSEGLASVGLNGKIGLIDKSGKFVIKPKFDSIWSFREGLAKVGLNGKYGLIDKSGKIVIEPKFDDIRY
ncbi:WG repeat-containing protein, partial [Campylobacter coli]|nr:WG repeat-containing protein [Campylobacter coli]ECL9450423.1 WG repeat-containing protein [Campylobacter coli]